QGRAAAVRLDPAGNQFSAGIRGRAQLVSRAPSSRGLSAASRSRDQRARSRCAQFDAPCEPGRSLLHDMTSPAGPLHLYSMPNYVVERNVPTIPVKVVADPGAWTDQLSALCSIRIKNITTRLARTCHCTKTRRSRALSRPSVARWRCQFWADCTTNMFEFEFPTRTTKPVYGLRPSQIKTDRSISGCYRAAVATKRGIYERLCGSFK